MLGLVSYPAISQAADTEYYVDDATGDNGDDGLSAGNAWATIQFAVDNVGAPAVGDYSRINILNTNTYVITANIDVDTVAAGNTNPINLEGYSSTIGDGGIAIIDCDDGAPDAAIAFNVVNGFYVFKNLQIDSPTDTAFAGNGVGSKVTSVTINNAGDNGMEPASDDWIIAGCEVNNATDWGILFGPNADFCYAVYNYVHDCGSGADGGIFFNGGENNDCHYNVIDSNVGGGAGGIDSEILFFGNTIYNHIDNMVASGGNADNYQIINNIFDTASDNNVEAGSGSSFTLDYNNVYRNASGLDRSGTVSVFEGRSTADPDFVDAGGGDFNLGASTAIDNLGYPGTIQSNSWNNEPGALMFEETGGGGTTGHAF